MATDTTTPQHPEKPAGTSDIAGLLETARKAALEAGKAILEVYASGDFAEEAKADNSPLTRADKAAHELIEAHLQETRLPILSEEGAQTPFEEREEWQWYWLIDPLDGTKEFLKKNGEFTVNIALMHKTVPVGGVVYAPVLHTLYYGSGQTGVRKEAKGEVTDLTPLPKKRSYNAILQMQEVTVVASRSHLNQETESFIDRFNNPQLQSMGSSLKFMLLAENKADIYPRFAPTMEWDTAAAHAILKALNKNIYQPDLKTELVYNKPELLNPSFVAF